MRKIIPTVLATTLVLAGCNEHGSTASTHLAENSAPVMQVAPNLESSQGVAMRSKIARGFAAAEPGAPAGEQAIGQRRIAEVQTWQFEIASDALEAAWRAHHGLCESAQFAEHCEVVQANVSTRDERYGARHANLEMRVSNTVFDAFMQALSQSGVNPVEKSVSREDRTLQWVDLQARKANAEQLRDRLKLMVAEHPNQKLADLLSLERELSRVQSSLDAMEAQTRVLSRETQKVRLVFRYQSAPQTVADDVWRPIRDAWHGMGRTFSHSVGAVMLFVASVLPWLVVLIPGWMLLKRLSRGLVARTKALFGRTRRDTKTPTSEDSA